MLFSIMLVLLVAGTVIIFSKDLMQQLKRFLNMPFARLWVPLLLVSWGVLCLSPLVLKGFGYVWAGYVSILAPLVDFTPIFKLKIGGLQVLLLTLVSLIPTLFAWFTTKPFRPFSPPYWGSIYLCVVLSTIIVLLEG